MSESNEEVDPGENSTTTYEITTARSVEVDIPDQEVQQAMAQTGAESPREAIETIKAQQERERTQPQEKLLVVSADVEEVE